MQILKIMFFICFFMNYIFNSEKIINGNCGIVTTKEVQSIYEAMREFIKSGYTINQKFKPFHRQRLNILLKMNILSGVLRLLIIILLLPV